MGNSKSSTASMTPQKYLNLLFEELVRELKPLDTFRQYVGSNSALLGGYAEAAIRGFISRFLEPLHIAHGSIIHPGNYGKKHPQLDSIVWSSTVAPPIFEKENFAIVPRGSAHAILEIKSSCYLKKDDVLKIEKTFEGANALLHPDIRDNLPDARSKNLIWLTDWSYPGTLCVCCARLKGQKSMAKYIKETLGARAVILFEQQPNGELKIRPDDVAIFINFLLDIRAIAHRAEGFYRVKYS